MADILAQHKFETAMAGDYDLNRVLDWISDNMYVDDIFNLRSYSLSEIIEITGETCFENYVSNEEYVTKEVYDLQVTNRQKLKAKLKEIQEML